MLRRAIGNPVLANLLMITVLGIGLLTFFSIRRETFPTFALHRIQVVVELEGAGPEEIEESVCVKIEEAILDVEGIKKIESAAFEGYGVVVAKVDPQIADPAKILEEIEKEVDQIDFPEDAEEPQIKQVKILLPAAQLAVYGEEGIDEKDLKAVAEEVRSDLLRLGGITQVEVVGSRKDEISIEIDPRDLEALGLKLEDVAERVRAESLELEAGSINGREGSIRIRTRGKRRTGREFEDIVVLARPDGTKVTLADIGTVYDAYEQDPLRGRYMSLRGANGRILSEPIGGPAIQIHISKTSQEDLVEMSEKLREYVSRKEKELPEGVRLETYLDMAPVVDSRLDLLYSNIIGGLVIVFVILFLYMGFKTSFWVSFGVPWSFLGTIAILYAWGGTLNMNTTFALIVVLGMLVDDAIVISDNVHAHYARGVPPLKAAIDGTREVIVSVSASAATTMVSFAPVFFIPGEMGQIMAVLPFIVISALAVSLFEGIFILPNHLSHSLPKDPEKWEKSPIGRLVGAVNRGTDWVGGLFLLPLARLAIRNKLASIGLAIALVAFALTMMARGVVAVIAMPEIDTDYVFCAWELPPGAPIERTEEVARRLEEALLEVHRDQGGELVKGYTVLAGGTSGIFPERGRHMGQITVALQSSDEGRTLTGSEISAAWRRVAGEFDGIDRMRFASVDLLPTDKPIEIQLSGKDIERLREAADVLKAKLRTYPGVVDNVDDDRPGMLEFQYRLDPEEADVQGVTVADVALQLRSRFNGSETVTLQRGREDVDVMVRVPEGQRRTVSDLDDLTVRTAAGVEVPIQLVTDRSLVRSVQSIQRVNRERTVTVSTGMNEAINNADKVTDDLEAGFVGEFGERFPDVKWGFAGQKTQLGDSMGALFLGFAVALFANYGIIALTFRSWLQPIVIMLVIPISFFGTVLGHWIMGHDFSLLSMAGFVGVAGLVINDSIVLVECINDFLAHGKPLLESLETSIQARLRAIWLTSVTTFGGLAPMMFETSAQAQFLVPVAIAISFGVLFETIFVLILIPSMLASLNDFRRFGRWLRTGHWPTPEEVEPAVHRERHMADEETQLEEEVELPEELEALAAPPPESTPGAAEDGGSRRFVSLASRGVTAVYERAGGAADQLFEEASALSDAGDTEGAIRAYLAAQRAAPSRADIHQNLGLLRMRAGDLAGAISSFGRALEIDPSDADSREWRAWAALKAGDYEMAVRDFGARLSSEPDHLLARKGRATALLALGRTEEALVDLDAALEQAPGNAEILYLRGNAWRTAGDREKAIADYDLALERRPDNVRALVHRGQCHLAHADCDCAIRDFDEALRIDPDYLDVLLLRGRAHLEAGRAREALEDFSTYLIQRPDQTQTYYLRGKAKNALGDEAGAAADYQAYLEHHPDSKRRRMLLRFIGSHAQRLAR